MAEGCFQYKCNKWAKDRSSNNNIQNNLIQLNVMGEKVGQRGIEVAKEG